MSNNLRENEATPMPSRENNSASVEPKISSEFLSREEGRAMLAEYEEIANRFMAYMREHNLLLKPCPAPHPEDSEKKGEATGLE